MKCRHCHFGRVTRPRGLCWSCYYTPSIRDCYPSTSKYGRRGLGNFNKNLPPPACPTDAAPGSPEKILILMQRAQSRQGLWHPEDADASGPKPKQRELAQVG
jgi:hypothetical protein